MSVCVVHRDGWAAFESRTTLGDGCILPVRADKAFVASGWLTASVGTGSMEKRARRVIASRHESEVIDALAECFQEDSEDGALLMVNRTRDLYLVDARGCAETFDDTHQFWAIGCADMFVLGYLGRIVNNEQRPVVPDDAVAAIKLAARYDAGIDDRVKVVWLGQ